MGEPQSMTNDEASRFDSDIRNIYHKGELLPSYIHEMEKLPEWSWDGREEREMGKAREIFNRSQERGRLPVSDSKDPQEKKDAIWIQSKRQSKKGKGYKAWYPELDEIAHQYGFKCAFEPTNWKINAINYGNEIFDRARRLGSLPSGSSKDAQERKDAIWIYSKRKAKNRKGSIGGKNLKVWYPELDEIATQYGFKCVFDMKGGLEVVKNEAHEIFERARRRGSLPCWSRKDSQECKDAKWISGKRQAKNGKSSEVWHPEFEEISAQYGFPEAFEVKK